MPVTSVTILPSVVADGLSVFLQTKNPLARVFCLVRRRATLPGPGWVQVPSLLVSLTAVFGMGTGVTSPLEPPVYRYDTGRSGRSEAHSGFFYDDNQRSKVIRTWHSIQMPDATNVHCEAVRFTGWPKQ